MVVPRIATSTEHDIRRTSDIAARNVSRSTARQSGWAKNAVITYANSTSVSHLKIRAIVRYEVQEQAATISSREEPASTTRREAA